MDVFGNPRDHAHQAHPFNHWSSVFRTIYKSIYMTGLALVGVAHRHERAHGEVRRVVLLFARRVKDYYLSYARSNAGKKLQHANGLVY